MNCLLYPPKENMYGKLLWMPPYIYPQEYLEDAVADLTEKDYWMSLFPEGDGITFNIKEKSAVDILADFSFAFPWMDIRLAGEEDGTPQWVLEDAIIVLPVQRLLIEKPIYSKRLCLFPAGQFQSDLLSVVQLTGEPFDTPEPKAHRDLITSITDVTPEVFQRYPVIVLKDKLPIETYQQMNHFEDVELIARYARWADDLMDLLKHYAGNYYLPDWMPSRPGICNDRHSAILLYFPSHRTTFLCAREVESKNFIRGIGMEFTPTDLLDLHPFLHWQDTLGEVGRIAQSALRLNSAIQEMDDYTMKLTQVMILFEMIADPDNYVPFKNAKKRLIAILAADRSEYERLSMRFKELTGGIENADGVTEMGLRTKIVHLGKRIEDLLSPTEIRALFDELQRYAYTLIDDLIMHYDERWSDYQAMRERRMEELIN